MANNKPRVLILGGGFGGMYAALEFERALERGANVDVTLVNHDNFFLFTPMLHEVAASDLDITNIVSPIRKLLRRVTFFHGEIESIDLVHRRVGVSHGHELHCHSLPYDHLVLALGSTTNFFGIPGLAQRAFTMKSLSDAIALRNHLIANLEEADFACGASLCTGLLNFVVAGGGFAGVETIAAMNDFLREAIRFFPHLREDRLRVILVSAGPVILPELGEKLGTYAQRKLAEQEVEIHSNCKVTAVKDQDITLSDGSTITTNTVVWTAGISPHPLLDTLPCPKARGRVLVNEYLEVPEWSGVWALGDCALVPNGKTGEYHPPTAQHALREGRIAAQNILATVRQGWKKPFVYSTIGLLAPIGKRTGVANILGVNFSGFIAWWLWRTIYLFKLPRFEKKVLVALDWTLDVLFSKDLVHFRTTRPHTQAPPHEELEHSKRSEELSPHRRSMRRPIDLLHMREEH
ncbi:NAD(P)/FAD-dependent oxidoreductase [Nitrospira sp. BLG_1]|uniref:NAD(P)/FAD-dependent oxidoreductase n=1 Tax=Nitrospira sp. BLG_1 TaxID=3395883 RepID=UPI0039BD468B